MFVQKYMHCWPSTENKWERRLKVAIIILELLTLIMYSMRLWECFSMTDSIQISGFTWSEKHSTAVDFTSTWSQQYHFHIKLHSIPESHRNTESLRCLKWQVFFWEVIIQIIKNWHKTKLAKTTGIRKKKRLSLISSKHLQLSNILECMWVFFSCSFFFFLKRLKNEL